MCKMLQKYSTIKENYVQYTYKKTIDRVKGVWYYISKERETEKLEEPNERVSDME